jgi:hypothetical protein
MDTIGIEKLIQEQIDASKAMTEAYERKAQESTNQAILCQKHTEELERERISRDAQTSAIERSNNLIQERNQKLEIVLDIIQKTFIDEKTIESLIHEQSNKINDVNATLIKIATILQLQATRVIEALVVDDKTKEEYHRLLATIESGLRRSDAKVEFKSERDMNLKSRDIGG